MATLNQTPPTDMVHLLPRLVRTNEHDGLTEADADRAIALLEKP